MLMFKEIFCFAKSLQKEKRIFSFCLPSFEAAVLFALNFAACRVNAFINSKNSSVFSALLFFFVSVLCFCFFKAFNLRFFSFGILKKGTIGVKKLFGCALLELLLVLIKAAVFLFCFLPFFAMLFLVFYFAKKGVPLSALAVLFAFCVSLAYVSIKFCFRFSLCFFLCEYIYASKAEETLLSSIKSGIQKINGKTETLRKLKKSFFPLEALCLFFVFAPFVFGYKKRTLAIFAYGLI